MDRISNLPPNIIQTILTLMPMRDAFRTSVLSQSWRHHCRYLPTLYFADSELFGSTDVDTLTIESKFLNVVYPILLLHQGHILEFHLSLAGLESCREIDQIVHHLSRNPTLKEFTLWIWSRGFVKHKLQPPFYELKQLTYLDLQDCVFQPPRTFNGFRRLVTLTFYEVSISAKVFLQLISNCPLLKTLYLIGDKGTLTGCWNSNFAEFFECLPLLELLSMSQYPFKCFATGNKLPSAPIHLKGLDLEVDLAREFDLRSLLLLVSCCPNIETIRLLGSVNAPVPNCCRWHELNIQGDQMMCADPTEATTAMKFFDDHDLSYVKLDHLRVLKMRKYTMMKPGMDFMKLVLAKAPILKKISVDTADATEPMLQELIQELIQYPRASPTAKIKIN